MSYGTNELGHCDEANCATPIHSSDTAHHCGVITQLQMQMTLIFSSIKTNSIVHVVQL